MSESGGGDANADTPEPPLKKGPGVTYSIPVSNAFEILADASRRKTPAKAYEEPAEAKKQRIPPITVPIALVEDGDKVTQKPDPEAIRRVIIERTRDFNIQLNKGCLKIFASNLSAHQKVIIALKSKSIAHFSHPTEASKTKRFVLYGLPKMEPDRINELLNKAGIDPVKINYMSSKSPRFLDQCNYILYFDGTSATTLSSLKETKALNYTIIQWDHYKPKKSGVSPCRNCCEFGHGAINCNIPAKCIICAEPHNYKQCHFLLKKHEGKFDRIHLKHIKCGGCGGNHTATYPSCPIRLTYIENQPKKKSSRPAQNLRKEMMPPVLSERNFPTPVYASQSYNTGWNNQFNQPNKSNIKQDQSTDLYTMEECQSMLNNLFAALQSCTSKQQQAKVIADYSFKYFCNFSK